MDNKDIKDIAKEAGVPLWKIAERLGCNDGNFSRKLRKELSAEQKKQILNIIAELSSEAE